MKERCPACGKHLGSNYKCETCLGARVKRDAENASPEDAGKAIDKGAKWAEGRGKKAPSGLFQKFQLLYQLLKDWKSGRYQAPWKTIAAIIGGLLYVINPFDLIPDFIPVVGWLDDAAVLGFLWKAVESDIDDYLAWRNEGHKADSGREKLPRRTS